ncbi:MAG: hypothetical protein P8Y69_06740 [Gammaproteobacteria bacterium]
MRAPRRRLRETPIADRETAADNVAPETGGNHALMAHRDRRSLRRGPDVSGVPQIPDVVRITGYWSGLAAASAVVAYDVVQLLQVAGVLRFPLDEMLIFGTSMCIVVPFLLEMLAFHHVTSADKKFWTHAALLLTVIYAVFVTANYVVQLATVIPSKLNGTSEAIRVLEQTPHSLFWNFDAIGYVCMGLAALMAAPALATVGFGRWVRISALAHALVTPLIAIVYFYPTYSQNLLFLGLPWAVTAPVFMMMLAIHIRRETEAG